MTERILFGSVIENPIESSARRLGVACKMRGRSMITASAVVGSRQAGESDIVEFMAFRAERDGNMVFWPIKQLDRTEIA